MKYTTLTMFTAILMVVGAVRSGFSQSLDIDFIELAGKNIVIHYNLDDGANSNRQFLVQLYSSQDNFTSPLTRVTGDFGTEVSAGVDKKIVWDVTQEFGQYKGNVSFELRGRVYVPFVKVSSISEGKIFKRGKNYPVNWASGNLSGQVNIELFNSAGERLWGENNVANIGKFDWYVPGSIKKGRNYKLKFTNARDRNDVVYSSPFAIRPKVPLFFKVAGIAIIAAAVELALTNSSNNSSGANALVGPPGIPSN